jgi:capsid portal protein
MKRKKTTAQTIKKAASKLGFAKFDIINLAVPERIDEVANMQRINTPYVPFGVDNLFPQFLAEIKRKSPTHRAILGQKKILSIGQEFHSENEMLIRFIENVNIDQTLREVYSSIIDDYYSFGNAYLQIVRHKTGINLYHIDATKCRISKDQKQVYIHPDWTQYQSTKKDQVIIPVYPDFDNNTSILHFKDYEPTFSYYGLPDFVAALEWIGIDNHLQKYNLTKFENNFTPSCIVEINGDMGEMEAEELVKEAQKKWTGQGNNSKILFLVKNGDTSPANITMLNDSADGSFMDLQRLTSQNIITSHRWQPAMSGIVSSGKLNSTGSEIRVAWEMVMGTIIKDVEGLVLNKIKKTIRQLTNLDTDDLQIVYEPPISFLSDITPSSVLTINEQRELLGFEFKENGDVLLTNKTSK